MNTPIKWGMIHNNHWGPVAETTYGVGITRVAPHLSFQPFRASVASGRAAGPPARFQWQERDGAYVMDLGLRRLDDKNIQTLERLAADVHAAPPRLAEHDKRVEAIQFTIDQMLIALQPMAAAGYRAGLVTPANVVLATTAQEDYLRAAQIRRAVETGKKSEESLTLAERDLLRHFDGSRAVILPDAGFLCPESSSSVPSWLSDPHPYGFLWDRPPAEEHRAPLTHQSAVRSAARITAWTLTGQAMAGIQGDGERLAAQHGAVWATLRRAEEGGFETVEAFRSALQSTPLATHRFGLPWGESTLTRLAPPPNSRRSFRRLRRALLLLMALLLAGGALIWKDWPRAVMNGLPRRTVTGASVRADVRESKGQKLAIRWGADGPWQPVSKVDAAVRSQQFKREGQYEITLLASSRLLGLIPVSRQVDSQLTVEDVLRAVNTPLTERNGQFLRVRRKPDAPTAPNELRIDVELPEQWRIGGAVSIGGVSLPIRPGQPVSYRVSEPGAYVIDWIPDDNLHGVHGEFVRLRFDGPQASPQAPLAAFDLISNPATTSDLVRLDPSRSVAGPGRSIVGLDVDWGEGKGWQIVSGPASLERAFLASGDYDVSLRVSDDLGATAAATQRLTVHAPPSPPPQTPPSQIEVVEPGAEGFDQLEQRIKQRAAAAGGASGAVQVSLVWGNRNDLDLWVRTGATEVIYYGHKKSSCGGVLDVDLNVSPSTAAPVENIVWPAGSYPRGPFRIYVNHYKNHGLDDCQDPTPFVVRVEVQGRPPQVYRGEIVFQGETNSLFVAEVDPLPQSGS